MPHQDVSEYSPPQLLAFSSLRLIIPFIFQNVSNRLPAILLCLSWLRCNLRGLISSFFVIHPNHTCWLFFQNFCSLKVLKDGFIIRLKIIIQLHIISTPISMQVEWGFWFLNVFTLKMKMVENKMHFSRLQLFYFRKGDKHNTNSKKWWLSFVRTVP